MIDPIDSLAFTIQANPGVYALLLGSGVSRAARIPTGWEITLDLVKKLEAASGEEAQPTPELWYSAKYEEAPEYSKLIDQLARTQADRQLLLRQYFEPTRQEREENAKQPTVAHRAIAELVAKGYIRVIITTNFDRLIERALDDAGVAPTVVSSPDQVRGMLPLVHTQHCIIKVHGDYLDTRIRNTPSELSEYSDEFNQLLDRILDEFGLVVCGWSADWDIALRDAIFRVPSRRFTTFWAVHGKASDEAQRLIGHRSAQVINIEDAGEFFQAVQQRVESIETFSQPHPLSTEAAVSSLKRYLSEPRYRIQHSDLVSGIVERVVTSLSAANLGMNSPDPGTETITARVRTYEAACSTLLSMAAIGGIWAEEDHLDVWQRALEHLALESPPNGYSIWLGLRRYPATLTLYALGLGALYSNNFSLLGRMLSTVIPQPDGESKTIAQLLPPYCMFGFFDVKGAMRLLEGMEKQYTPLNDWIQRVMRQHIGNTIRDSAQYNLVFDKLEILMALSYAYHDQRLESSYWAPPGSFVYRTQNRRQICSEIEGSISTLQYESPYVKGSIFGETPQECMRSIELFNGFIHQTARSMGIFN